ncbi:MAG: hypothetical protein SW833_09105 [Cyanobacteriota bacterium]|nr:hypothetical protein [Cyanobacteriota bacterium]
MFVRWEQRKENLEAMLVEVRSGDRQSQERVVKLLARIRSEDIHTYWGHMNFWKDVSSVLEDFPDETRERIVSELSRRVKPIPNWAVEKMEGLLDEHHHRGEAVLQAINEENRRHEMRLAELTLQGKRDHQELDRQKADLLREIGLELASGDRAPALSYEEDGFKLM